MPAAIGHAAGSSQVATAELQPRQRGGPDYELLEHELYCRSSGWSQPLIRPSIDAGDAPHGAMAHAELNTIGDAGHVLWLDAAEDVSQTVRDLLSA